MVVYTRLFTAKSSGLPSLCLFCSYIYKEWSFFFFFHYVERVISLNRASLWPSRGSGLFQEQVPVDMFESGTIISDSIICGQARGYFLFNPTGMTISSFLLRQYLLEEYSVFQMYFTFYFWTSPKRQQVLRECLYLLCWVFK